jgi:cytochrome c oxidase subunit II
MNFLLILISLVLIAIVAIQIGKVSDLASKIRGEEEIQEINNNRQGLYSMLFLVVFLVGVTYSGYYYQNYFLGFGPHIPASAHGGELDSMFKVTLLLTGIVFVITHILLFYFSFKYRGNRVRRASFVAHDTKLELIWTAIPAVVMAFLVIKGLDAWNEVMADVSPDEEYLEIEATGYQFAWLLRYPGADGLIGEKNFRLINSSNPLGQNWNDVKNHDDIHVDEIVLPVGKKVRVRITSRDVLHNFYLPHFRVKMDAVPGMPTYFVFTPTVTTAEYRQQLRKYDEYNVPSDPADPTGPKLWETFNYELACAELCGTGHYSMRKLVRIVSQEEYNTWLAGQSSYYESVIKGTSDDTFNHSSL